MKQLPLPLVSCGFPSPADDYLESPLDLNALLIEKPAATFFVRAKGDSMVGAGVYDGDLLIVDRSLTAKSGSIILAIVNGEFTVKRMIRRKDQIMLCPESPNYPPIMISLEMDFQVWGVITYCLHKL